MSEGGKEEREEEEEVAAALQALLRGIEGVRVSVSMRCEHAQC